MTQKPITERSLEQLLRGAAQFGNRQYTLAPHPETGTYAWLHDHVLIAAGEDAEALSVARKRISKVWPPNRGEVGIDADGHPYFLLTYGDHAVAVYDSDFLGNHSFATAMAQLHQRQIDRAYAVLQETKSASFVLEQFNQYIDDFIERLPALKDDIVRSYYRGDLKQTLKQLPYRDHAALGLLALKSGTPHVEFDLLHAQRPGDLFRDQVRVTESKRQELFRAWYRGFIDTKAYERKIKASAQKHDEAFTFYLKQIETGLRDHGFEKVDRIRGL